MVGITTSDSEKTWKEGTIDSSRIPDQMDHEKPPKTESISQPLGQNVNPEHHIYKAELS
jgi:hypothetical protein